MMSRIDSGRDRRTMFSSCMVWARMCQLVGMRLLLLTCNEVSASASYASVSFVTSVPSSATHMLPYSVTLSPSHLTPLSNPSSKTGIASQLKHRRLNSSSAYSSTMTATTTGSVWESAEAFASSENVILNIAPPDSSNSSMHRPYFGDFFFTILDAYYPIHGYLSLLVCIFGIFANILNIVVLTRKEMLSPTNAILTGLAVADLMVMIEYIPFTIHTSIENYNPPHAKYTFPWAVFTLFHAHFSVIFHSISSWLTVILAVWRYTSVSFPTESKVWCSMNNAKITIGITYIIVPILCIPLYLSFAIQTDIPEESLKNATMYIVTFSDISQMNDGLLKNINFWVFSVGLKIVPCILLTYLSLALIRVLLEAERRRQRLKSNMGVMASHVSVASAEGAVNATVVTNRATAGTKQHDSQQVNQEPDDRRGSNRSDTSFLRDEDRITNADQLEQRQLSPKQEADKLTSSSMPTPSCSVISASHTSRHVRAQKQHHPHVITSSSSQSDRTTKMLLAILLLYLLTEMPNGIITLLVGLLGESFQYNVYNPLGEIFDILALINSGINFILLASMSRLFRKTFCKIFWPRKYHSHYQRDKTQNTEKTNVNHNAILRPNAALNQSAYQTTTTTLTNKSSSHYPVERQIEMNQLAGCGNCDAGTAIITVTEASNNEPVEDNDETTMV